MTAPARLELRHSRARSLATALLCLLAIAFFLWRWAKAREGGGLLLAPAILLFGTYGGLSLLRALDRRPVAVLDEDGIALPDRLARPLPWRELVEVQERRFGRTRLFLYVRDLGPYLRPDRPAGWTVEALVGKILPGFERPRLVLETGGLDHSHARIREVLVSFWSAARGREDGANPEDAA